MKFDFVYSIADCVPEKFLPTYVARLLDRYVKPGGRLIVGHYGSKAKRVEPLDVAEVLNNFGFPVAGSMKGGRHIKYEKATPLANLHLTLLDKVGVHLDSFADSQGKVTELLDPLSV